MPELTPYEQERLRNIERNRELLAQFNIKEVRDALANVPDVAPPRSPRKMKSPNGLKTKKKDLTPKQPRKSSRLRGLEPLPIQIDKENTLEIPTAEAGVDISALGDELWDGKLLTADEYFDEETRKKAIRTDGRFRGWINPALIEKYQFEGSAAEAWEKNGGGTFSYKNPTGMVAAAAGQKKKSPGGRFSARAVAQAMFKKNPNMYFYRHNEPGEEQWTGDWTEEEKIIFLDLAREHGCGDKWGVFASYIPHRVGYQCSNHYRSEILPSGLIFDDNYQYTPSGSPRYVGSHKSHS